MLKDPLNMALWQKIVVLVVISTCRSITIVETNNSSGVNTPAVSTLGIALVSGFGGLLTFYIPEYTAAGKGYSDITQLMTYPTLFM